MDLSGFPDLVVIYLGMRVNRLTGIKTLLGFGPQISSSAAAQPEGLLVHETIVYSLFPPHIGMRQYWRNLESLLTWTRTEPHRQWWKSFHALCAGSARAGRHVWGSRTRRASACDGSGGVRAGIVRGPVRLRAPFFAC